MKLMLAFASFLMSASLGFAGQKNVFVQCKIDGPVYSGTIDFEQEMIKWAPASPCQDEYNGYFHQDLHVPAFTLIFNNVSYISKSEETFRNVFKGGCDWSIFKGTVGFSIFEAKSNQELSIWSPMTESAKFPNQFRIEDNSHQGGGSCHVRVL